MTSIQHRRDTESNWTSVNPVLLEGEIGYDTTNKKFKIGDGVTAWADLAYQSEGGSGGTTDYNGLTNKPKINNIELVGNINPLSTNIQPILSPKGAVDIRQDGSWYIPNGTYNETDKVVNLNASGFITTNGITGAYNVALSANGAIGDYVDSTKLLPKNGVITPFYTNTTFTVIYSQATNNRIIFGVFDGTYFTPKAAFAPVNSTTQSVGSFSMAEITGIQSNTTSIFTYDTTHITASSTTANKTGSASPLAIKFDNNQYTFKCKLAKSNTKYVYTLTPDTYLNDVFKSCTHIWLLPYEKEISATSYTKIFSGVYDDEMLDGFNNLSHTDQTILPDSEGNIFTTSISVKTDNTTIKVNDAGELEAITPDNVITTENIASDTTIVSMNDAIDMAQGDVSALATTVAPLVNGVSNCLTKVPQRIKYSQTSSSFTLLAGTVLLVPYGLEDLSDTYPIGSTFVNDNYKVVDRQYADGKFFVWIEVQNDIVNTQTASDTNVLRFIAVDITNNSTSFFQFTSSDSVDYTGPSNKFQYRTDLNVCETYFSGVKNNITVAFTPCGCLSNGALLGGTVSQLFNGFGYMGSACWIDKGVEGYTSVGRDPETGALISKKVTTTAPVVFSRNLTAGGVTMFMGANNSIALSSGITYNKNTGKWLKDAKIVPVARCNMNTGVISDFQAIQPFEIANAGDASKLGALGLPSDKYIDLTLPASNSELISPANGYVYLQKRTGASNEYIRLSNVTSSLSINSIVPVSGGAPQLYMPIKKGDRIGVGYSASGETVYFRLIYANSEV